MSTDEEIAEMLMSMGFYPHDILRSMKCAKKHYDNYNVEHVTEMYMRLFSNKCPPFNHTKALREIISTKLKWQTQYVTKTLHDMHGLYECFAREIYGKQDDKQLILNMKQRVFEYITNDENITYFKSENENTISFKNRAQKILETLCTTKYCELIALSEIYNVKVIVYGYKPDTFGRNKGMVHPIYQRISMDIKTMDIPIILLSKTKEEGYGIISHSDVVDIQEINKEIDLGDYITLIKQNNEITLMFMYYWVHRQYDINIIPDDIYHIIKMYIPQINRRPIGEFNHLIKLCNIREEIDAKSITQKDIKCNKPLAKRTKPKPPKTSKICYHDSK